MMKTLFKKFEILEVLKKDDHASVYLAHHIYLDKDIILKVLNSEAIENDPKVDRFKREAKILAKLNHPSIIKVLDFGTEDQNFYISFEYFKSTNLRSFINDRNLSILEKENLTEQLISALNIAHKNGVIHRDIKPENILVDENLNLKLGDFGLALAQNENFVTSQYSVVGTPCYMSPEQMQGEKLDFTSDLFSAGIVIYELFTNQNPLLGNDVNQTINKVVNFNEELIDFETSDIPENIKVFLKSVLLKDKTRRINSLDDFIKQDSSIVKSKNYGRTPKTAVYLTALILLVSIIIYFLVPSEAANEINYVPKEIVNLNDSTKDKKVNSDQLLAEEKKQNAGDLNETVKAEGENAKQKSDTSTNLIVNNPIKSNENLGKGKLSLTCFPWAEVYIDNEKLDTTPLTTELSSGSYLLKLVHPEYPIYSANINIEKNRITNLQVNLDTLFGYLNCKIFPWGEVFVDNQSKGSTPMVKPIRLNPGFYQLKIKNPNFDEYNSIIEVSKNDTINFEFNFTEINNTEESNWNKN